MTNAFEAGDINPANLGYVKHLQAALSPSSRHDFIDAAATYVKGIETLAINADVPKKCGPTITYAFLSVIAERLGERPPRCLTLSRGPTLTSCPKSLCRAGSAMRGYARIPQNGCFYGPTLGEMPRGTIAITWAFRQR